MRATTTRASILAAGSSRGIVGGWIGRLLAGQGTLLSPYDVSFTKQANNDPINRTLSHHVVRGVTPHKIHLPFSGRTSCRKPSGRLLPAVLARSFTGFVARISGTRFHGMTRPSAAIRASQSA
jgi:hypothetical protein